MGLLGIVSVLYVLVVKDCDCVIIVEVKMIRILKV